MPRGVSPAEHGERLGHDRALDAAARHRARDLARRRSRPSSRRDRAGRSRRRPRPGRSRPAARRRATARCRPALPSLPSASSLIVRSPRPGSSSDASEWPSTNSSTNGSAAAMPRRERRVARADAFSGFTHTMRCATRCSRAICSASTSGSPRSQPSERITTTAPRAMPRMPHSSLNARRPSPRRVPPDQSTTRHAAAAERDVGIAARQLARDAGEPGAERERLDPVRPDDHGVQEPHQGAGVRLHRAAHVAEAAPPGAGRVEGTSERAPDRLAAGPQRPADRAPQVGVPRARSPARRPEPPAAAERARRAGGRP